ncbi:MAG TPA: hypothetical protein VFE61_03330 [Candidatus Sulfotelmatobacter sp.]|nr:hypothetical protein [Candidatus Sulfotelmatobacter sp.]
MMTLREHAAGEEGSRAFRQLLGLIAVLMCCSWGSAQQWVTVRQPFPGKAGLALLRTDGKVMVEETATGWWWLLVPDDTGSYTDGVWIASGLPLSNYDPTGFASAVLPDGRIIVEGGEHNFGQKVETTVGAIFDSTTGVWTEVPPPANWKRIGDAPSVVLPDRTFMMGAVLSRQQALLIDPIHFVWKATGTGKLDQNSEEGWTLLPNGKVLTIDLENGNASELYDPGTGKWTATGNLPFFIGNKCGKNIVAEIGPAVLRPNGTVFAVGANNKTAIYHPATEKWSAGPSFPDGFGSSDGPGAILPNGNVLVKVSPCFAPPSIFFEFDGTKLNSVPSPPRALVEKSGEGHMLVLPNRGHILYTDGSSDVEVYVPNGSPNSAWLPTITSHPATVTRGHAYIVKGRRLNGMTQGAAFGDDAQMATNYPLVRITNNATGHVFYARTKNFSTMGVATGTAIVSATFIPPTGMETGASKMVVVANGLASAAVAITVQ